METSLWATFGVFTDTRFNLHWRRKTSQIQTTREFSGPGKLFLKKTFAEHLQNGALTSSSAGNIDCNGIKSKHL